MESESSNSTTTISTESSYAESEPLDDTEISTEKTTVNESIEMNSLQALFASLSTNMTREEIDNYITSNGLVKFAFTHDSAYYIGYEQSSIFERGRDRVGEAVDIDFVTSGDVTKVGTVKSAKYAVHTESSTHYSLEFKDGVFYYEHKACSSGEEAVRKYLSAN